MIETELERLKGEFIVNEEDYSKNRLAELLIKILPYAKVTQEGHIRKDYHLRKIK